MTWVLLTSGGRKKALAYSSLEIEKMEEGVWRIRYVDWGGGSVYSDVYYPPRLTENLKEVMEWLR